MSIAGAHSDLARLPSTVGSAYIEHSFYGHIDKIINCAKKTFTEY